MTSNALYVASRLLLKLQYTPVMASLSAFHAAYSWKDDLVQQLQSLRAADGEKINEQYNTTLASSLSGHCGT